MKHSLATLTVFTTLLATVPAQAAESFEQWVAAFKAEAMQQGIEEALLNEAFDGMEPLEDVVELDRKQPESTLSYQQYMQKVLPPSRIETARTMLREHGEMLSEVSEHFGVEPEIIVALWGMESDFGNRMGDYEITAALATLAYEGRRADFFRKELLAALQIIQSEKMNPHELVGSWAGAMGQCQFMPSSFLSYAVDGNNDGWRDIWDEPKDVFSSIANYLKSNGWQRGQGWGSVSDLQPAAGGNAQRLGEGEGAPWVTPGSNFEVLLKWNRSRLFATAAGTLADKIKGE